MNANTAARRGFGYISNAATLAELRDEFIADINRRIGTQDFLKGSTIKRERDRAQFIADELLALREFWKEVQLKDAQP